VLVVSGVAVLLSAKGVENGEWRNYSGDNGSTKYSPLSQISKDNVATLSVAWRRPAVDAAFTAANPTLRFSNNFRATPIMVGGLLYVSNGLGFAEAIDPATGKTVWVQNIPTEAVVGGAKRGVA